MNHNCSHYNCVQQYVLLEKINNIIMFSPLFCLNSKCGCHLLIWRKLLGGNFFCVIMDDQIIHFTNLSFSNIQQSICLLRNELTFS